MLSNRCLPHRESVGPSAARRWGLWLAAFALCAGCRPVSEDRERLHISWTGAARPIEEMVDAYVHARGVSPENQSALLSPKHYAKPTPFFLYEGNDDAVTLALSARLGTSYPPVDVYFIDLYWFQDFEPQWLTSFETLTVPIGPREPRLKEILAPGLRESCELDGKLYAVPLSIRGNCLYYRADLIDDPPRTWPELIDTARRVLAEQPEGSKLRYGLNFHWDELHTDFYPILWGYGGGPPNCLVDQNQLDQPLSSPENLAAIEMFYRLLHEGGLTQSVTELRSRPLDREKNLFQSFARGETLFLIDWTNRAARIAAALENVPGGALAASGIGIAPIPHSPEHDQSYSTIGSWGWVVASEPRSPHSLDFVREMATPGAQLHFFEKHAEIPIYAPEVLTELPNWNATRERLSPYHLALLNLVRGAADRPGVALRDRPGRKDVNRLILEALHRVFETRPGDDGEFNREAAQKVLADADVQIVRFLQRLERLGIDARCEPSPSSVASPVDEAAAP